MFIFLGNFYFWKKKLFLRNLFLCGYFRRKEDLEEREIWKEESRIEANLGDLLSLFSFTSMRDFVNWESRSFIVPLYSRINSFISGVFGDGVKEGGARGRRGDSGCGKTSFEGAFEK